MVNTEPAISGKYLFLKKRADACGLDLKIDGDYFDINHKHAAGLIRLSTLRELELFIRGYELAECKHI